MRRLYLQAFLVRAVVGVIVYALSEYYFDAEAQDIVLLEDARGYERIGHRIANDWLSGRPSELDDIMEGGTYGWLMVAAIAAFYYLLQGLRIVPLLLVFYSAITALVPVYTYRIASHLGASETTARKAALLVAFSPAFVFWSGTLYKEGLVLICLNLLVYHTLRLQSRWEPKALVIMSLSLLALSGLRLYLAIILSLAVSCGLLLGRRKPTRGHERPGVMPLLRQAVIVAIFISLMTAFGFKEHQERVLFETRGGVLVQLDTHRRNLATEAHSGYLIEADITRPEGAAELAAVGLFYFLTAPGPWQFGRLRQNLVIPETTFWIMLYPLIVVGMLRARRANWQGTAFLVVMTAGMCVVYALVSGNIGVAYRMRSQVWLLWAPFAAWGWEVWWQRRWHAKEALREAREARLAARRRRLLGARLR